jgi:hypothetical protein
VAPPPAPTDLREAVARWVFALNNPGRLFDTLSGLADDAREAADEVLRLTQAAQAAAVAEAEQRGRREGFHAGFAASGEGWNGEYPPASAADVEQAFEVWLHNRTAGGAS